MRVNKTVNIEKGERKREKGVGWKYEIIIKMQNMAFISIEPENFNGKNGATTFSRMAFGRVTLSFVERYGLGVALVSVVMLSVVIQGAFMLSVIM